MSNNIDDINKAEDIPEEDITREEDGKIWFDADGAEWVLYEDYDAFEQEAEDQVRYDLEQNEPEMFPMSWLMQHMTVSSTDARLTGIDEADSRFADASDEEIAELANMTDEYDELVAEWDSWYFEEEGATKPDESIEAFIYDIKDDAMSNYADEVEAQMNQNPLGYFEDIYGPGEDADEAFRNMAFLDTDAAVADAIATDGAAHFLSRYDGDYEELEDGSILVREN